MLWWSFIGALCLGEGGVDGREAGGTTRRREPLASVRRKNKIRGEVA